MLHQKSEIKLDVVLDEILSIDFLCQNDNRVVDESDKLLTSFLVRASDVTEFLWSIDEEGIIQIADGHKSIS